MLFFCASSPAPTDRLYRSEFAGLAFEHRFLSWLRLLTCITAFERMAYARATTAGGRRPATRNTLLDNLRLDIWDWRHVFDDLIQAKDFIFIHNFVIRFGILIWQLQRKKGFLQPSIVRQEEGSSERLTG